MNVVRTVNISEIIDNIARVNEEEDAFFVVNTADIVQKVKLWREIFPHIEMFYLAYIINAAIEKHFADKSIRIIGEPGRYCCSSAYTLATLIHSHKIINTGLFKQNLYYICDGVYGNFGDGLIYREHFPSKPLKTYTANEPLYHSIIYGQTLKKFDMLSPAVLLPQMAIGDWLVFENMGAYSLALRREFHGFPIPKVHAYIDVKTWSFLKNLMEQNKTIASSLQLEKILFKKCNGLLEDQEVK